MSCGFWMRRKRLAAKKRAEAQKPVEQVTQTEQAETKPRKKAGAKNGKSDTDTDTKS